jgi:hypothetical protein
MENPLNPGREEARFIEHLKYVGFSTRPDSDRHGWRLATHPIAPPLGFRAGPILLSLHAEYLAGIRSAASRDALLREVNRCNAAQWLVRCTLIPVKEEGAEKYACRLQASLPMGLPAAELGACLFTWIRESTAIERIARLHDWASPSAGSSDADSHEVHDDQSTTTN